LGDDITDIILHFSQFCNIFLIFASFFQKTVARATNLWYNISNKEKEVILWDPDPEAGAEADLNIKRLNAQRI
jgi:hypothetical protein